MIPEQAVREALASVTDPQLGKTLAAADMVGEVSISGGRVSVQVRLPVAEHAAKEELVQGVRDAVAAVEGVEEVDVRFTMMDEAQRAKLAEGLSKENPFSRPDNRTSVIGISSGKGGVGKSTVTVNLAAALQARGHKVGVMDADIWGFSIPRMFGLRGQRPAAFNGMIMPLVRNGVKVISIGFFLENEEKPVVWRGPMLHKALEQFLTDVHWGDDLEYLLIDLPPGTGDIAISLATFLPQMGVAVVTTPQPVAQKVAERAAHMTDQVKLKTLGVIENMSGIVCAHCDQITSVFGEGGGRELADTLDVPLLAQLPLVPEVRERSDAGEPFVWANPDHPVTAMYHRAAEQLAEHRPRRRLPVMQIGKG